MSPVFLTIRVDRDPVAFAAGSLVVGWLTVFWLAGGVVAAGWWP